MIPNGFELNAKQVATGEFATAVIDAAGELKFWFNRLIESPEGAKTVQDYSKDKMTLSSKLYFSLNEYPEGTRTFQGYSKGKMTLSSKFFCAINDVKELSCFRVIATTSSLN